MDNRLTGALWRVSSRSGGTGDCVEVAANLPRTVRVRDSKDRNGPVLAFKHADWTAFLSEVKAGTFDL